jgi:uncharacterized membrane protein YsdA (DUF1294 family)
VIWRADKLRRRKRRRPVLIKILAVYFILINVIAFWSMRNDKRRAVTHSRRTPEKRLFLYALFGGSAGIIAGMSVYRHKTKHLTFTLGMPPLFLLNAALIYLAVRYLA